MSRSPIHPATVFLAEARPPQGSLQVRLAEVFDITSVSIGRILAGFQPMPFGFDTAIRTLLGREQGDQLLELVAQARANRRVSA